MRQMPPPVFGHDFCSVGIQQVDDVLEAETILIQKFAQLGFKLDLLFQRAVTFPCFQQLGTVRRGVFQTDNIRKV